MVKTSKTAKRKAVTSVFSLVRSGHSITNARKVIAKELNLSSTGNALWTWQKELGMVTPVITEMTKVNNNVISRQRIATPVVGTVNWRANLGSVFTSLINKDGEFTHQDASAISQIANAALGQAKYDLEIHKLAERTTTKRDDSLDHLLV
mgnify:CR=1 FL=1